MGHYQEAQHIHYARNSKSPTRIDPKRPTRRPTQDGKFSADSIGSLSLGEEVFHSYEPQWELKDGMHDTAFPNNI